MLSFTQSIKKIDEAQAARLAAAQELSSAAEATAKYVVEVNPRETSQFREHLRNLAETLARQPSDGELQSARDNFQTELREYATRANAEVHRLNRDLNAAAEAMQSFAQGVSSGSYEHELLLQREFQQLTRTADHGDLSTLRAAIHDTVAAVTISYQELRKAHNLVVTQLRDEIRTLQQTVELQTRPAAPAALLEKRILDQQIEDKLRARRAFHLLVAKPALPFGQPVPEAVRLHAHAEFIKALRALAGTAPVAEWSAASYAVLLPAAPRDLGAWEQELAACHLFQHNGLPRTLRTEPRLVSVECTTNDSPSQFFSRLHQAIQNLPS